MIDRTSDFVNITVLFDTGSTKQHVHRPLSQDARHAQQIADQMRQQELCLRDLQNCVDKKSIISDDTTSQITTLTDILKRELAAIEKNIQAFQLSINSQRNQQRRHHQAHFRILCESLKSRCAKSAKQFHLALQQHSTTIRERSTRRSKFSHGGASPMVHINTPLFARTTPNTGNGNRNSHQIHPEPVTHGDSNTQISPLSPAPEAPLSSSGLRRRAGNMGTSPFIKQAPKPQANSFGLQSNQQQMQQHYSHPLDSKTRYQNAMQVENTIVEITGMYTRMATMVAEQGEIISRIDDNVDLARADVEAAQGELLKLYNMVSGNRSLIMKIFAILMLMIFLFVVIF